MPETLLLSIRTPSGEAAPFTPSDIAGMQFWFKPETIPGNQGDFISGWPSSAPSFPLRYATNTTGNYLWQPQKTNTFGTLVGTNALHFDGLSETDYLLVNDALGYASNIASCSIFVVYDGDANSGNKAIWFASRGTATNSIRHYVFSDASEYPSMGMRTSDLDTLQIISNNVATTVPVVLQADFLHDTGAGTLYTNGMQAYTDATFQSAANTSATNSLAVNIGWADSTSGFIGWIAEIIVYVPAVSAANRLSLSNYFKGKYGL